MVDFRITLTFYRGEARGPRRTAFVQDGYFKPKGISYNGGGLSSPT